MTDQPITEDWLKEVGFRWHEINRQPWKHWTLWLASAFRGQFLASTDDLGIELTPVWYLRDDGSLGGDVGDWFCWLRADTSHLYSRFLHIRYLRHQREVIQLVEALTGIPWNAANHRYGMVHNETQAERLRREDQRMDRQMLHHNPKWREIEKDEARGGALPEHLEAAVKAGQAK
jgi:hypothetical protein